LASTTGIGRCDSRARQRQRGGLKNWPARGSHHVDNNPQTAGVVKASLSDIKQGSFVGVTAMPQADGNQRALEVHIFPEAMRGTGEGHYPWDFARRAQ
jgi:hypothetical protein